MKKLIFIQAILLFSQLSFSQTGTAKNITDSISLKVIYYLQTKHPDSIYALAGERFKGQLTKENFESIVNNQVLPLNNFQNIAFVKIVNGINKYKVAGTSELQLLIGLDAKNMIETLLIQPYKED